MVKSEVRRCIYGCKEYFNSFAKLEDHFVEVHGVKRKPAGLSSQERIARDKKNASLWATNQEETAWATNQEETA
jgi:hypothetical protein